jgi:flavin-dependent dehydrogenase
MDNFEGAGLLEDLIKQDYQVKRGAIFLRGNEVGKFDFSKKFGNGWNWTWQVPRDHFDMVLAESCIKKGVSVHFEAEVNHVDFSNAEFVEISYIQHAQEKKIHAKYIIDASGNGRVLAKQLNLEAEPKIAQHSSIFTQIKDVRRESFNHKNEINFDIIEKEVWSWYIPFSNGNTSLGFVAPSQWFQRFSTNREVAFKEMLKLSPAFYSQFKDLEFNFTPVKIENIAKNVTQLYGDRFVLTGNSAEFLDPVFSSGVSFATESGLKAAKLVIDELNGKNVDWDNDYVNYMQKGIEVFSSYVKEWYTGNLQEIIFHQNPNPEIKEQICAILAGYVWDNDNPFVKKHYRLIKNVADLIKMEKKF